MKSSSLTILIIGVLVIGTGIWIGFASDRGAGVNDQAQCKFNELTFYYLDECSWCQKIKNEGTIDKIEALGVKVNKINAGARPVRHKLQGVPAFVINDQVYEGYKTFEEIKELLDCPEEQKTEKGRSQNAPDQNQPLSFNNTAPKLKFLGEKGENLALANGEIKLKVDIFNDHQARFFNTEMPSGKTIYFFVVKDKNGIYRAAANACAVCFKTYKGFRQEGEEIVCNNCGNRYPIEKIATEKGGCNPGPINPDLEIRDGEIVIKQTDLEKVLDLF